MMTPHQQPPTPEEREVERAKVRDMINLHEEWAGKVGDSFSDDVRTQHDKVMTQAKRGIITGDDMRRMMMLVHGENHPMVGGGRPHHMGPQFGMD